MFIQVGGGEESNTQRLKKQNKTTRTDNPTLPLKWQNIKNIDITTALTMSISLRALDQLLIPLIFQILLSIFESLIDSPYRWSFDYNF